MPRTRTDSLMRCSFWLAVQRRPKFGLNFVESWIPRGRWHVVCDSSVIMKGVDASSQLSWLALGMCDGGVLWNVFWTEHRRMAWRVVFVLHPHPWQLWRHIPQSLHSALFLLVFWLIFGFASAGSRHWSYPQRLWWESSRGGRGCPLCGRLWTRGSDMCTVTLASVGYVFYIRGERCVLVILFDNR